MRTDIFCVFRYDTGKVNFFLCFYNIFSNLLHPFSERKNRRMLPVNFEYCLFTEVISHYKMFDRLAAR